MSALKGKGMDEVRRYLLRKAHPGPWLLEDDEHTDQPPHLQCQEVPVALFSIPFKGSSA